MSLDVAEIRARGESFEARRRELWLDVGAGFEARPAFDDLYEAHPFLADPDTLAVVERGLAGASEDEEGRMRCLLEWLADRRVDRALAPLHDEYLAWEASTTVEVEGRELPFRQLSREIKSCGDRERRRALARRRSQMLEEAASLWLDLVEREREAVRDLGYGDYREARDRLSRQDHVRILEQGRAVVRETDDAYRRGLEGALDRLGVPPEQAEEADGWALRSMPEYGEEVSPDRLHRALSLDLRAMGLDPDAGGRLILDLEARPLKRPISFCSAPRVPGRVVGVLGRRGGGWDARDLLAVTGEGLGRAYVDPHLPFERRLLGDPAVGQAHADLFRGLLSSREWMGRLDGLGGVELDEFLARARWLELLAFRRDVALLEFQLRIWDAPDPAAEVATYPDTIFEATGFQPDPQGFVEGLEAGLGAAGRVRGRILGAMLRRCVRDRYGPDWFRRPAAGPFLRDVMARGWRTPASLVECLDAEGISREALEARFREERP